MTTKAELQKILEGTLYNQVKINTFKRPQRRVSNTRTLNKQMRIRKEANVSIPRKL